MKTNRLSGRERGEENLAKVRSYLAGLKMAGQPLPFEEYAARLRDEARSEYRLWLQQHRGWRQARSWERMRCRNQPPVPMR